MFSRMANPVPDARPRIAPSTNQLHRRVAANTGSTAAFAISSMMGAPRTVSEAKPDASSHRPFRGAAIFVQATPQQRASTTVTSCLR